MANRRQQRAAAEQAENGPGNFQIAIVNGTIVLEFDRPMLGVGFGLRDAEKFHHNFGLAIQHLATATPLVDPARQPS